MKRLKNYYLLFQDLVNISLFQKLLHFLHQLVFSNLEILFNCEKLS